MGWQGGCCAKFRQRGAVKVHGARDALQIQGCLVAVVDKSAGALIPLSTAQVLRSVCSIFARLSRRSEDCTPGAVTAGRLRAESVGGPPASENLLPQDVCMATVLSVLPEHMELDSPQAQRHRDY